MNARYGMLENGFWTSEGTAAACICEWERNAEPYWQAFLPLGLEKLESEALSDTLIQSVRIPDGCINIQDQALSGTMLCAVYVPDSVESIGTSPFRSETVMFTPKGSFAETWGLENGYAVIALESEVAAETEE